MAATVFLRLRWSVRSRSRESPRLVRFPGELERVQDRPPLIFLHRLAPVARRAPPSVAKPERTLPRRRSSLIGYGELLGGRELDIVRGTR